MRKPRLGFLGVGWIGRHRMEMIHRAGFAEVAVMADSSREMLLAAEKLVPSAMMVESFEELLDQDLDGVVIATPSALHAEQTIEALRRGMAVFCQKPLGRNSSEVRQVLGEARSAERLLGVDFSYRFTEGMQLIRQRLAAGEIGTVFAVKLSFHNAYGPDKDWFYRPDLSGGGCVMDLGVHLVDLALWALEFPRVRSVSSRLFAQGASLRDPSVQVEDFATARMDLETGATFELECSWKLHAGCDCVFSVDFHGTGGGLSLRNIGGSFYDFEATQHRGTSSERLTGAPDSWGGRAAVEWSRRLADGAGFDDREGRELLVVTQVLDQIYGR